MDSKKSQELRDLLASLPPSIAAKLARAVEVDRLAGGKAFPHELILDGLRPALRKAQPVSRTLTPLRLFCRPFEDTLTLAPRKEKQKGRIARSSVMPVWNWVTQKLVPDAATKFSLGVKTAALSGQPEEAIRLAQEFWPVAAQAIQSAIATDRARKQARAVLESDAAVEDAREMALLMTIGADIMELQERIPRPLPALTDEHVWMLRAIYDRVVLSVPDAAPYIGVVAMHRLERPWEALKLPQSITRQTQDTLISSTDLGIVGEILFGDIEAHAATIRAAQPRGFDADVLVESLAGFTALSSGMVKAIDMRRDGKWGQRLLKDRAAVAEVMENYMSRSLKEISSALVTIKSGSYAGGPRVPDISHAPDAEKSDRALAYVRLMTGCRTFAAAASFGASNKDAIEQASQALKSYSEDLLKEMRAAEGDKRKNADQFFTLAVEMASLLFSAEEAEFLRRRGRAATVSAAA